MINEWEQKLVDALRSNKYTQAKGVLRKNGGHCCLGVACDVIDPNGWTTTKEEYYHYIFNDAPHCAYLPPEIARLLNWFSIDGCLSIANREGGLITLVGLNDKDLNFDQIADVIAAGLILRKDENTITDLANGKITQLTDEY